MKFEMSGFDDLEKKLKEMEKAAKELEGTKEVSFGELFNDNFMRKYTDSDNLESFFGKSGYKIETEDDFDALDESEFDAFVNKHSEFNDWEEMLGKAGEEYAIRKLGL